MRALRITGWKQPPELVEVPDPEPSPGEVVVRVGGAGACHSDLHLLHDFEPGMMPFDPPFTLGHENAGWVHALGAGVTGLEVGEPVAVYGPWGCGVCPRCRVGAENYCERQAERKVLAPGIGTDGGMAPLLLVPEARHLVPIGDLDPVDAAPLTDAALTPYHAIRRSAHLLVPGATVVVVGVGGLGHLAVQILRATSPVQVIAVDTREAARATALDAGAHHALDPAGAADEIRGRTGGRGADLVVDCVGSDATLALAAAVTRSLGQITLVGIAGGSLPFSFFSVPYEASLTSTYWGSIPELVEVIALAQAGAIRAEVHRFDLDGAAGAYEQLARGELTGRAVVVPT